METASRFIKLMEMEKPFWDENGNLKQGSEFKIFENKYGQEVISCILNWKDGFLHSEEDIPAVQFDDSHTEHWENGKLSNNKWMSTEIYIQQLSATTVKLKNFGLMVNEFKYKDKKNYGG